MDLSVIIPHYNLPPSLLTRAIDSIVSQWSPGYESWEIIVVDDGSDLPPTATIGNYQRDNIRLLCQTHARQGAARNFGLTQAQGQYILFLDADDYIFPGTLPKLLTLAQRHDLDILRFQTVKITALDLNVNVNHNLVPESVEGRPSTLDITTGEEYLRRNNLPDSPSTFIFRRELATTNNVRFPEGVYLEDCMFTACLHHFATTLAEVDTKAYAYYQRTDSTVNTADARHKELLRSHHLLAIDQLGSFIQEQRGQRDTTGLQHKLDYLVVDYIRRICNDLSLKDIREQHLPLLRSRGLYPLPLQRSYGYKYQALARLANTSLGLRLLKLLAG